MPGSSAGAKSPSTSPVAKVEKVLEPTGVGDGFRAGFLASRAWGLSLERAAQVGSLVAAHVIETVGPQDYVLDRVSFLARLAASYGAGAADEVSPHLTTPRP